MLLNDPLQHRRWAGVIPRAFGINDGDPPLLADAQTVCLAAIDQRLRADESQFIEPLFEKIPRRQTLLLRRALRFRLVGAQENVALEYFDSKRLHDGFQITG